MVHFLGDSPKVVVICELKDSGNSFTSVDHSVYGVSFPLMIHLRNSCNKRFMPSTSPLVQGTQDVRGLCLKSIKWHSVMISVFINSVPLSVTSISGKSNFAIQCS